MAALLLPAGVVPASSTCPFEGDSSEWFYKDCDCSELDPPHTEDPFYIALRVPQCIDLVCHGGEIDLYEVIEYTFFAMDEDDVGVDEYGQVANWPTINEDYWYPSALSNPPRIWTLSEDTLTTPGLHIVEVTLQWPCPSPTYAQWPCLALAQELEFEAHHFTLNITVRDSPEITSEQMPEGTSIAESSSTPAIVPDDGHPYEAWLEGIMEVVDHYWFDFIEGSDPVLSGPCADTNGVLNTWAYYTTEIANAFDSNGDPVSSNCSSTISDVVSNLEFLAEFANDTTGCIGDMAYDAENLALQGVNALPRFYEELEFAEFEVVFHVYMYPYGSHCTASECEYPGWHILVDEDYYDPASTEESNVYSSQAFGPVPLDDYSNEVGLLITPNGNFGTMPVRLFLCGELVHTHEFKTHGQFEEDLIDRLQDDLDDLYSEFDGIVAANEWLVDAMKLFLASWYDGVNELLLETVSCDFTSSMPSAWENLVDGTDYSGLYAYWDPAFDYLNLRLNFVQSTLCDAAIVTAWDIEHHFPESTPDPGEDEEFAAAWEIECPF